MCSSTKKTHGFAETTAVWQRSLLESSDVPTLFLNYVKARCRQPFQPLLLALCFWRWSRQAVRNERLGKAVLTAFKQTYVSI